jgi:hypothetical protein
LESSSQRTSFRFPSIATTISTKTKNKRVKDPRPIVIDENTKQADIIRQTLAYSEEKNDVEAYRQLYLQQQRKEQNQKKDQPPKGRGPQKEETEHPAPTKKEQQVDFVASSNNKPDADLLHNRLWDFDDWSIGDEAAISSNDETQVSKS